MVDMLKKIPKIILQVFFLWMIYYIGSLIVGFFKMPIPGNVLGMLILFGLLSTGIVKEHWFTTASDPLLKHLAFFFVPLAVGLMEWGDLFMKSGILLLAALVLSAMVSFVTTGGLVQLASNRKNNPKTNVKEEEKCPQS